MGVRTMIFDATGRGGRGQWALTASWVAGARLYGALGRLDHHRGVHSWAEALEYLATVGDGRQSIDEVQFWGHGLVGRAFIGRDILDIDGLSRDHPMAPTPVIASPQPSPTIWVVEWRGTRSSLVHGNLACIRCGPVRRRSGRSRKAMSRVIIVGPDQAPPTRSIVCKAPSPQVGDNRDEDAY
jgi:hypothetical protein